MEEKKKNLTSKQQRALELLTSGVGMTYTAIAEEVGVNRKTLWRWCHEPQYATFQQCWKQLNDEKWMVTVEAAREAALKLCLEGKTDMVKFVLQNAGYNPTQKVEADVKTDIVINIEEA
jgi:hypothetical protein